MPSSDVRDVVLFLAPGFIALWIYQTFAFRRPRTDWHWLVWSIIASLPIDFVARLAMSYSSPIAVLPADLAQVTLRAALALALGVFLSLAWRRLGKVDHRRVRRFVERFTDSVWDAELERAFDEDRTIEVLTLDGSLYVGHFRAAREDAAAEPWIYLVEGYWWKAKNGYDWEQPNARGVLIHRDQIRLVTIRSLPVG